MKKGMEGWAAEIGERGKKGRDGRGRYAEGDLSWTNGGKERRKEKWVEARPDKRNGGRTNRWREEMKVGWKM